MIYRTELHNNIIEANTFECKRIFVGRYSSCQHVSHVNSFSEVVKFFATQALHVLKGVILFSCTAVLTPAIAAVNCDKSNIFPAVDMTVTLDVSSYVGNDVPVGSTIYHSVIRAPNLMGVNCDAAFALRGFYTVINKPSGPAVDFSSQAYRPGPVFPTNVQGVGVIVWYSGTPFSDIAPYFYTTYMKDSAGSAGLKSTFDISLVKTGPIAPGAVVDAGSFPTVAITIPAASGYNGLPLTVFTVNFVGSVRFVASTCTTPNVEVSMGKYEVSSFRQKGSVTPWVDASINLLNCPTFSGLYADGGTGQAAEGTSTATGVDRMANRLTIRFTPNTPIIDAGNGIIGVDDQGMPGVAATGIGLQLGFTPINFSASATQPLSVWTPGTSWDVQPPTDGRRSFKIPIAARYYQTEKNVTAGPANTTVTFEIDYK